MKDYTHAPLPMLANKYKTSKVIYPVLVQEKINGVRCLLAPDGVPYSRAGTVIQPLKSHFPPPGVWLDGEIYLEGISLQRLAGYCNRRENDRYTKLLQFYAFDIIHTSLKQESRLIELANGLPVFDNIVKVQYHRITNYKSNEALYDSLDESQEGLMYRNPNGYYTSGRTNDLLKRKKLYTGFYECLGVNEGLGKFKGTTGGFVCRTSTGVVFHVSGAELDDTERDAIWSNPPVNQLIKVRYPELSESGKPMQAQFGGLATAEIRIDESTLL